MCVCCMGISVEVFAEIDNVDGELNVENQESKYAHCFRIHSSAISSRHSNVGSEGVRT